VRLQIISVCVKKYQQAFLAPLLGTVVVFSSILVHPRLCIFSFFIKNIKYFHHMQTPTPNLSASKGEFLGPLSKPIFSGYELRLGLIAMVQVQPFLGLDHENPC
jgi:hypothetical protein